MVSEVGREKIRGTEAGSKTRLVLWIRNQTKIYTSINMGKCLVNE